MTKAIRLSILCFVTVLCLCLSACDIESMLGNLNPFAKAEEATLRETRPADTRPAETTPPTIAPTEPPEEVPTEPEPDLYWVCAIGGLNIRSGPSRDFTTLGTIEDGTVVEPIRWVDGWAYIESPAIGWCSGDYLHPLGWYNNVKLPVGQDLESELLVGKWLHATEPISQGNRRRTRVGVIELHRDGTFSHSIAEFISYTDEWKIAEDEYTRPHWIGEYQFDGKTLTLNYMAYVNDSYDQNGRLTSRQYLSANYILELPATPSNDSLRFAVPNGEIIPCFDGYGTSPVTQSTLYRVPSSMEFPYDVCDTLRRWFS